MAPNIYIFFNESLHLFPFKRYMHVLCIRLRSQSPVKCFSGYIFNFASTASKKLSESVAETSQNLKKRVEEGNINSIIDKVILHVSVFGTCLPFYYKQTKSGQLFVCP